MTTKIEFHITRRCDVFALTDEHGHDHLDACFETEAEAADMAIRFAQDQGALYAIYYASGARLV